MNPRLPLMDFHLGATAYSWKCNTCPEVPSIEPELVQSCSYLTALANGDKQTTLLPELGNPAQLGQPGLRQPVVGGILEEIARLLANQRAGICPHVIDSIFLEPFLNFSESMAVLLRMLILVAQPRLPSRRLIPAIA
jgi:hypothetical protein